VIYVLHKKIFVDGVAFLPLAFGTIIPLLVQFPLQWNVGPLQILAINIQGVQVAPHKAHVYFVHQLKYAYQET